MPIWLHTLPVVHIHTHIQIYPHKWPEPTSHSSLPHLTFFIHHWSLSLSTAAQRHLLSGQYLFHSYIFLSFCDVQTSSAAELWNHLDWTLFLNEGSERFNQSAGSVFKTQSTDLMFDSHVIRTNFLPTLNPLWSRSDYFTASSVCSPPSRAPLSGAFTFTTHSLTIF